MIETIIEKFYGARVSYADYQAAWDRNGKEWEANGAVMYTLEEWIDEQGSEAGPLYDLTISGQRDEWKTVTDKDGMSSFEKVRVPFDGRNSRTPGLGAWEEITEAEYREAAERDVEADLAAREKANQGNKGQGV